MLLNRSRSACSAISRATFAGGVHARAASVLILGEHASGAVDSSTRAAVSAAKKLGSPITVLLAGEGSSKAAASAAGVDGVDSVLFSEAKAASSGLAEGLAGLMKGLHDKNSASSLFCGCPSPPPPLCPPPHSPIRPCPLLGGSAPRLCERPLSICTSAHPSPSRPPLRRPRRVQPLYFFSNKLRA